MYSDCQSAWLTKHDEDAPRPFGPFVEPSMYGTALNDNISLAQLHTPVIIQDQRDCTMCYNPVVKRHCAMEGLWKAYQFLFYYPVQVELYAQLQHQAASQPHGASFHLDLRARHHDEAQGPSTSLRSPVGLIRTKRDW